MADIAENTRPQMVEYPARLQMSMLAPVRKMAELIPEGDKEVYIVGYVFGEARGVSYRNNPNSADGENAVALTGVFEGVPAFGDMVGLNEKVADRALLRSGVLFLPTQAQDQVAKAVYGDEAPAEKMKRGQRSDKLGVTVPLSFEIGIRKSGGPVGYEWVTRGLANVVQVSPLDRMRAALQLPSGADLGKRIAAGDVQMIDDGKRDAPALKALAAPKAAKKSGSKRK